MYIRSLVEVQKGNNVPPRRAAPEIIHLRSPHTYCCVKIYSKRCIVIETTIIGWLSRSRTYRTARVRIATRSTLAGILGHVAALDYLCHTIILLSSCVALFVHVRVRVGCARVCKSRTYFIYIYIYIRIYIYIYGSLIHAFCLFSLFYTYVCVCVFFSFSFCTNTSTVEQQSAMAGQNRFR